MRRRAALLGLFVAGLLAFAGPVGATRGGIDPSPYLPEATVGVPYETSVSAVFDSPPTPPTPYIFSGLCPAEGDSGLPPGLRCKAGEGGTTLVVYGTPTQAGKYRWAAPARPNVSWVAGPTLWTLELVVKPGAPPKPGGADIEVKILQVAHIVDAERNPGVRIKIWIHNYGPEKAVALLVPDIRISPTEPPFLKLKLHLAPGASQVEIFRHVWTRNDVGKKVTYSFGSKLDDGQHDPKLGNNVERGSTLLKQP